MKLFRLLGVLCSVTSMLAATIVQAEILSLEGRLPATPGGIDYQAYYDPNLDITWAANANINGYDFWDNQMAWVAGLSINGVTGWRLPDMDVNNDGLVVNCYGGGMTGCEDNEMGFMFWEEGITSATPGPFDNISPTGLYWSKTLYEPNPDWAWTFEFSFGSQLFGQKVSNQYAWAVHDGDVSNVEITGIWPADANVGDNVSVFIFGKNFTTDNNTEVYFNGIRQYLVAPISEDMLIVRLVSVTSSLFGPVTVTTPGGTSVSSTQFGIPLTGLNLTGVWPGSPEIGEWTSIFLFGTEFTTDGTSEVYFNGVRQFLVAPVSSEMLIVRVLGDALLSGLVTVVTPSGSVNSAEQLIFVPPTPVCNLQCSTPPPGKFCIAGQLRDTEDNQPILSDSLIEIAIYDGLSFAQNPAGATPLAADSITINSCGQFLAQGVTTPGLGFVVITTEDAAAGVDDYLTTGAMLPVTADSQIDGMNLYATRYTTDEEWNISAGYPFTESLSFYEVGAVLPVFMHLGEPVEDVVITVNGGVQVADDFYFSDSTSNLRTTIDVNLVSTGINGAGIIVNSSLVNHSGIGSEPIGCEWPSSLAASIAGVLLVHEMNSVQVGTNIVCQ